MIHQNVVPGHIQLEIDDGSAASRHRNLDRDRRNIRTITLHKPVAHKIRVIGANLLHGKPVPANAYSGARFVESQPHRGSDSTNRREEGVSIQSLAEFSRILATSAGRSSAEK